MNLQIIGIYTIMIVTLAGSAMFFFYLNTSAMMRTVETETTLSSAFLSSALSLSDKETEPHPEGSLENMLDALLPQVLREADEDIDIWVMDGAGRVLFSRGGLIPAADFGEDMQTEYSLHWNGKRNPFFLNQELYLLHKIPDTDCSLLMVNHCSAVNATQRQQFALFVGIELVLLCTMLMLLTNTIHAYHVQLIQLATTDELTALANRKSFQLAFRQYTEKHGSSPFAVFLADIDFFKQVNDGRGHAAGDLALISLAGHIRKMTDRFGGFAGRWGGDEFIPVCIRIFCTHAGNLYCRKPTTKAFKDKV